MTSSRILACVTALGCAVACGSCNQADAGAAGAGGAGATGGQAGVGSEDAGVAADAAGDGGSTGSCSTCAGSCDFTADPLNCGECGRSCGGMACNDGLCQAFVIGPACTGGFVVYGEYIYCTDSEGLWRLPKQGGERELLAARVQTETWSRLFVAEDVAHVVISPETARYGMRAMPISGGELALLFTEYRNSIFHPHRASGNIYFTTTCGVIYRAPATGGDPVSITSPFCNSFGNQGFAIEPSGTYGYGTGQSSGLRRIELATGADTILSTGGSSEMVANSSNVFWVTNGTCDDSCIGGALSRVGLDGGTPQVVVDIEDLHPAAHRPSQGAFANDAHIYFPIQDYDTNRVSIYRATPAGTVLLLYTMNARSGYAQKVQVDEDYVYLRENAQFVRIPK